MIDPDADRSRYRQVADRLRAEIEAGVWRPGSLLPSEEYLAQWFGTSRTVVRNGVQVLHNEGLVTKHRGQRTRVRELPERAVVVLGSGDEVNARMPTEAEQRDLRMPIGEPVFEVRRRDGAVELIPAASTTLRAP